MICFIIPCRTKDRPHFDMTADCLKSISGCVFPHAHRLDSYRIVIVESSPGHGLGTYPGCDVIAYDTTKYGQFNYNHALNLAISHAKLSDWPVDWFCNINNDVMCSADWLVEISKALDADPAIESACPNIRNPRPGVEYGYTLFQHLDGCCILYKAGLVEKLGLWDERFFFTYQDDDYLESMRNLGVRHAKVMSSRVAHLQSKTVSYCRRMDEIGENAFIGKWTADTFFRRKAEKYAFLSGGAR